MEVIARFLLYDHDITESLGGRVKQALEGRIVLFTYIVRFYENRVFLTH